MEKIERFRKPLLNDLHGWAKEHVEQNPHFFSLLEIDTEKYPDQKISEHTLHGLKGEDRLAPEVMNNIATDVDKRYEGISQAVDSNQKSLELMGEILGSKQNIILGTDHGELIDIALLLVKIKSALLQKGYDFETSMIANKMISFLGVSYDDKILPATKLLKLGIEELYLNIPNTHSSKSKMNVPKRIQREYNNMMIEHGIDSRLKATHKLGKAMLLGVALSGTVNKPLDVDSYKNTHSETIIEEENLQRTMVIGRANIGMLDFLSLGLTLPASAMLKGEEMKVNIDDRPLWVNSKDKLDLLMERVASLQQENDPKHNFVYDIYGDLPVIKPTE